MPFIWVEKAGGKKKGRQPRKTTPRLDALDKRMGSAIKVDLVRGIKTFKERVPKDRLLEAFKSGEYLSTMAMIPWNDLPEDLAPAIDGIAATLGRSAEIQIEKMPPNVNEKLRFDTTNPVIQRYLHGRTASLVSGIQAGARENIREVIHSGFTRAQTPAQLADRIKASIGLLPAHERALAAYKAGLSGDNAEKLGDAYEERLLTYRARMIARTESRSAITQGQLAVWREGANQGLIDRKAAMKEIVTDGNPCEICDPLDGLMVPLDELFDVDGEEFDAPPFHPSCMCNIELHFDTVSEEEVDED